MDEYERLIQFEEALDKLPLSEDTKWLMKYIRDANQGLKKANEWLAGIFMVMLFILLILLKVHWDRIV